MNIIKLFEEFALNAHHKVDVMRLINEQSSEVQRAFNSNDSEMLRKQIGQIKNYSDTCTVTSKNYADTCTVTSNVL